MLASRSKTHYIIGLKTKPMWYWWTEGGRWLTVQISSFCDVSEKHQNRNTWDMAFYITIEESQSL